jgi:hypothetical protein
MEFKAKIRANDIASMIEALQEIQQSVEIGCLIGTGTYTKDLSSYKYEFEIYPKGFVEEMIDPDAPLE